MSENKQSFLQLSEDFREKINTLSSYQERMRFSDDYYKKWYYETDSSYNEETFMGEEFNKKVVDLVTHEPNKSIFLFSPSPAEVKLFSKYFSKVFFVALPYIESKLPENAIQFRYDENYNIISDNEKYKTEFADYAFSHHVIEHIHHDDIENHLKLIHGYLKKGGKYVVACPSKFSISRCEFSDVPERRMSYNHHIGKYDYTQIAALSKKAGFEKAYHPLINPYLLDVWIAYRTYFFEKIMEKFYKVVPLRVLSFLGLNSLYIKLKK